MAGVLFIILFLTRAPLGANAVALERGPMVVGEMLAEPILEPEDVRKYLKENNLNEIETESRYIEGIGLVTTVYDYIDQTITLHTMESIQTVSFGDLDTVVTRGLEAIESGLVEVHSNTVQIINQARTISDRAPASLAQQVCPYLVGLIGYGHGALWHHALVLAGVNPAIALLIGLGEAAFWIWVSTHC